MNHRDKRQKIDLNKNRQISSTSVDRVAKDRGSVTRTDNKVGFTSPTTRRSNIDGTSKTTIEDTNANETQFSPSKKRKSTDVAGGKENEPNGNVIMSPTLRPRNTTTSFSPHLQNISCTTREEKLRLENKELKKKLKEEEKYRKLMEVQHRDENENDDNQSTGRTRLFEKTTKMNGKRNGVEVNKNAGSDTTKDNKFRNELEVKACRRLGICSPENVAKVRKQVATMNKNNKEKEQKTDLEIIYPDQNKCKEEYTPPGSDKIKAHEWKVTGIVNHRMLAKNKPEFLVKWHNGMLEWTSVKCATTDDKIGCVMEYIEQEGIQDTVFNCRKKRATTNERTKQNNKKTMITNTCSHETYTAVSYVEETNASFCGVGYYLCGVVCAICNAKAIATGTVIPGATFKPRTTTPALCCKNMVRVADGGGCKHVVCHSCFAGKLVQNDEGRSSRHKK
jgi:hypothetical protein